HQIDCHRWTGGGAAGHKASASLKAEQGAIKAFTADVLEKDVDALLSGQFSGDPFKTFGVVVDYMGSFESPGFLGLLGVAHNGGHGTTKRLRHLDSDRADPRTSRMH